MSYDGGRDYCRCASSAYSALLIGLATLTKKCSNVSTFLTSYVEAAGPYCMSCLRTPMNTPTGADEPARLSTC